MPPIARTPEPELMDLPDEARAYAETDFSRENSAFVQRLCQLAGGLETADCIDLGTGPADIPVRLCRARPGWHVTAVDAAEAMLDLAGARIESETLGARVGLHQADACRTGLAGDSFDVVASNSILHHVADPIAFWREVRRLCRPGGWVFIRDLFRPDSQARARQIVQAYASDASELLQAEFHRSLLAAYTPEEIRAQLDQAGLSVLAVRTVTDRHVDAFGQTD